MEKQIKEALVRLELLGLDKDTLKELNKEFQIKGTFENTIINCKSRAVVSKVIETLKKEYSVYPYYVIDNYINGNDFYNEHIISVLYISSDEELWDEDKESAREHYAYAYCYNASHPQFSEFGEIEISNDFGILRRIG